VRWLFSILIVMAIALDGLLLDYWWQTNATQLSGISLILTLLLPFAVILVLYCGYRSVIQHRAKIKSQAELQAQLDQDKVISIADPDAPWLNAHQIVLQTAFGSQSQGILEQLQSLTLASQDKCLFNSDGRRSLSRRISFESAEQPKWLRSDQDISHTSEKEPEEQARPSLSWQSPRAIEIHTILQVMLSELDETCALIAEKMMSYRVIPSTVSLPQQAAILHPAWTGADVGQIEPVLESDADRAARLAWSNMTLELVCLIPSHIDPEDQMQLQHVITDYLQKYHFAVDCIKISFPLIQDADGGLNQLQQACTALNADQSPRLLMTIGADSTLDQMWLNQQPNLHTPAEVGYAIILSNQHAAAIQTDLPITAHLTVPITTVRDKPISAGGKIGAEALLATLDEFSRIYKISATELVPELGVIINDNGIQASRAHTLELSPTLNRLDVTMAQTAYAGMMVESTDRLISAVSIALGLQLAEDTQVNVPILSCGGESLRAIWQAKPSQMSQVVSPSTVVPISEEPHEVTQPV
jgi:hypothetical protein